MSHRLFPSLLFSACLFLALAALNITDWTRARAASPKPKSPTEGTLFAVNRNGNLEGACTLKHTDVRAEVSGFLSRVTVTQEFENPFDGKIEAVYTFPLPQAAAVDSMTMQIGERTIHGQIMRREDAQAAYNSAKAKGQAAALLEQERPNIFMQSVANIEPRRPIKVVISYVETLQYDEGWYEWSFPMKVGARYNPAEDEEGEAQPVAAIADGPETRSDSVPDPARKFPRVMPDAERPGRDISIEVTIDAGVPVENLNSLTHEIDVERPDARRAVVRLKNVESIPNRDFILKYDVAGRKIEDAVLAHRSKEGGFFTLILQPPERVTVEDITPKELVFVLDTSGSMEGFPIEKAKETMKLALDGLYPQDTFNLITFSGDTRILFDHPVPATSGNLKKAKEFLKSLEGDGGTEMMKAVRAALEPSKSQDHLRIVCFMTDGDVGNDMEIIDAVKKYSNARVFAMGFGEDPNRFLLDKMTEYGRGEVEYVTENSDSSQAARRFHERVRNPLLTDLSVEWVGLSALDVYPKIIPDLFSAKPVILSGRYAAGGRGLVRLRGKMSGRDFVREIPVEFPDSEPQHDVLATLWARRKIDDLMGEDMLGVQNGTLKQELREAITGLGIEFKLMTQFTSFVAIEDEAATYNNQARIVEPPQQPAQTLPSGANASGCVCETVTVTASNSTLNVTSSEVSKTVEAQVIQDLPVRGRSIQNLVELAPGTVSATTAEPANPSPYKLSVNGQRTSSNYFTVDGVSANVWIAPGGEDPGTTAAGTMPSLNAPGGASGIAPFDAIQEVSIHTYAIDPQWGRVPGANVEITTRAGTNEFHGSLFEYFGNDATDANDWFANSRALRKPARRLNDFGGSFAGPIKRDRTFFFGSYEGLRLRQPVAALADVPSLSTRSLAPLNLQSFLNAYPLPTGADRADGFAEFAAAYANLARQDALSFRLDQRFGDQVTVTGRYNRATSEAEERGVYGSSLNSLNSRRTRLQTMTGSVNYVVSPTVVTEMRVNYSTFASTSAFALDNFGGAQAANNSPVFNAFFSGRADQASFDLQGRNSKLATGSEAGSAQRQFNLLGVVSVVMGEHMLKFGIDYRRIAPTIGLRPFEQSLLFNGAQQALMGDATRLAVFTREAQQRPVFQNFSAYGQDEWRVTPRLTLTYGVRWEVNPAPSLSEGRAPLAFNQVDDLSQLTPAPEGTALWKTSDGNFAPRAGLAYQVSQKSGLGLVVRAGFGLFYDLGSEQAGHVFAASFPALNGRAIFNAPFADVLTLTPSGDAASVPLIVFDPRLKLPYTFRWHASVEQEIKRSVLSASYVGSAGRRQLLTETLFDRNANFPFIRLTTNNAESDYDSFQLQFSRRVTQGFQVLASYTLSKTTDNFSQDSPALSLLRSTDAPSEKGPSDFDVRHLLSGFISYELPAPFTEGLANSLTRKWTLISMFNARSAKPLNVVYGLPTAYGNAYLRPDLVAGVPLYEMDARWPGGRRINPAAFTVPNVLRQGTLARNSLRGFPVYQVDLSLSRQFNFTDSFSLQLRVDAFNIFNRANLEDPGGYELSLGTRSSLADPLRLNSAFGQSTSMYGRSLQGGAGTSFGSFYNPGGPRTFQFSLKLKF